MAKYLAMLQSVVVEARRRAYEFDKQTAELLEAIHNVPDLLCRWPDMEESWVHDDLEKYEAKYCSGIDRFTRILKYGPRSDWQLKWKAPGGDSAEE